MGQNATVNRPGSLSANSTYARPVSRSRARARVAGIGLSYAVQPALHGLLELGGGQRGDLGEQLVAVGEVPVGRVVRDARAARHLAQHHAVRPARPRQLGPGVDEGRAEVAVVVRLRRGRHATHHSD